MKLETGWQLAGSDPDRFADPPGPADAAWTELPAPAPVGALRPELTNDELDGHDWWYRVSFDAEGHDILVLESVATLVDVFLDGTAVARSETMFRPLEIDVPAAGRHELAICCRALSPVLAQRRRPRARWRTRLVSDGNLRFQRTMLLGRAPGFAPGPAAVGLCAPVRLRRRRSSDGIQLRARLGEDGSGRLELLCAEPGGLAALAASPLVVSGPTGEHVGRVDAPPVIPDVAAWWPHTHGEASLYDVGIGEERIGRVGFRALSWPSDWEQSGLSLSVNGEPIFCRGAVWTPLDRVNPHADRDAIAQRLGLVRAAGMNMVRIPGTATYESEDFYALCDELGILVWQDMMFANLDYPDADPAWAETVRREATVQLGRLGAHPSVTVVCGGSECAQQVSMLGLDPALARAPLYVELLPNALAEVKLDAAYVPNSPWGGDLPFRPHGGVSHYYGVGAYLRELNDARAARPSFAAECLAFANVGEEAELGSAGVPRDVGSGWDFADVRDHYLKRLYGLDPVQVRWADPERYLELSRVISGEVMAQAMAQWRRPDSDMGGALVLWLSDLLPGAGWGLVDHRGRPKAALARLAQVLAPQAVWFTDEGLSGVDVHIANDRAAPLAATLRVALYRDGSVRVGEAEIEVVVPAHGYIRHGVEELLGRFVDVNWAYRFGPPTQDLVAATLSRGAEVISASAHFPVGFPLTPLTVTQSGLSGVCRGLGPGPGADTLADVGRGELELTLSADRVLYGVRIACPGWVPSDDVITLEPGRERTLVLRGGEDAGAGAVEIRALNLAGALRVTPSPLEG